MCLRVSGLPEAEHEDVTNVVLDFAKSLNSTISPADINRAHRVGAPSSVSSDGETATIKREFIIKFTNSNARRNLLRGRAVFREKKIKDVFKSEDLTPARKKLAYECRRIKRFKESKIKNPGSMLAIPTSSIP